MKLVSGIRRIGLRNASQGFAQAAMLALLQKVFGFNTWHSKSAFHLKPYKRAVVGQVNALQPSTILEVGCGLGDILSRLDARGLYGLDVEPAVVRAASFLHPTLHLSVSSLAECYERCNDWGLSEIDVLLMVNWPHTLPTHELLFELRCLTKSINVRRIVMDVIRQEASGYRFKHSADQLARIGKVSVLATQIDPVRDLVLVAVDPSC